MRPASDLISWCRVNNETAVIVSHQLIVLLCLAARRVLCSRVVIASSSCQCCSRHSILDASRRLIATYHSATRRVTRDGEQWVCVSRSRHAGLSTTAVLRLRPPIPVGARLFPEVPGAAETQEDQDNEQERLVFLTDSGISKIWFDGFITD